MALLLEQDWAHECSFFDAAGEEVHVLAMHAGALSHVILVL